MKILIAEDDAVSRLVLERTLERWGHEVLVASDGEEAWARFLASACQFVITDWMMPRTDGLELCRRIRAAEGRDYTYVILLTARSQKRDLVEGMSAGADDFITKPFDNAELEARIRAGERVLQLEHSLNERNKQIQAINDELQRRAEREHLLNQVSRALNESLELDDVLRTAVTRLQELAGASRAFTLLVSPDCRSLRVASEHCQAGITPLGASCFPQPVAAAGGSGGMDEMLVAHDLDQEGGPASAEIASIFARQFEVRSLISAPIIHHGKWLGVVGLHQCDRARRWQESEISLVGAMAQQMAVAIANAQLYRQVQEQALRDSLTGLYNRRYFDQILPREIERARRFGHALSLVMVDLDHLKWLNDQFGHQAGDAAISSAGEVLAEMPRRVDIAARYGGEEFAVILIETQIQGALTAAEYWRAAINQRAVAEGYHLSASFGVASYPLHAATAEDLIRAADRALYRAKRAGRNCVRSSGEPGPDTGV
jgi:diguanylate cyclase (GGDEF)-like protein